MTVVKVQQAVMESMTKTSTQGKNEDQMNSSDAKGQDSLFSDIMARQNKIVQVNTGSGVQQASKNSPVGNAKNRNGVKSNDTTKLQTETDKKSDKASQTTKKDTTSKEDTTMNQVVVNNQNVVEDTNDENVEGELENVMQVFLQNLQNILGISQEELNQLMNDAGFTATDLLDPANLQTLILNQFGADNVTDALLNEQLANALQQGMQMINDTTEQFNAILERNNTPLTQEMLATVNEQLSAKPAMGVEKQPEEAKRAATEEQPAIAFGENETKEFTVLVEKEATSDNTQTGKEALKEHAVSKTDGARPAESNADFVDYFASRVNQLQTDGVSQTVEPVNVRNIITQIVDQIKVNISQTQSSMQMLLNPENLGRVELTVAHKEGVMTAHFTVQNQVTKEALESSMNTLKESFEEQGLKVTDVEVTIGNYSDSFTRDNEHGQASEQQSTKGKGRFHGFTSQDDTEEMMTQEEVRTNYNGTVEYTA